MKTDNLYKLITIVSMVTMPAAAAINFGDAAFDALNGRTHIALAIIGGVFTGIGFETIGIVAGHRAVGFYSNKDRRWLAAGLALVAYIIIGVWEMWYIPFARFVPILSGLVYVLAGLQSEAESEHVQDNERVAWEREQLEKDREWQRQMDAKRLEIEAQNTLQIQLAHEKAQAEIAIAAEKTKATVANAEARKVKAKAEKEVAKVTETPSETKVNLSELSGSKLEIYKLFRQKPGASNTEIAETVGVSRQYVGQVKKELNGSLAS